MGVYLEALKHSGDCCLVEEGRDGFALVRKCPEQAQAFNDLAREAIRRSGNDYVALPRTDGLAGYDLVFIIPTDDA